jgi:hypothetical protein
MKDQVVSAPSAKLLQLVMAGFRREVERGYAECTLIKAEHAGVIGMEAP